VAPLNMILASFYLADRFHLNTTVGFTPINTFIAWSTLIIAVLGILLFFIPAYRGIRFGATFATVLALLSMIPLTFIAIAWIFNPSVVNLGELAGFPRVDGSSYFSDMAGFKWWQVYIAFGFLLTWNVIAMEAAACYIGECANPDKDAEIAMNLEGAYGVFIYTLIPIAFIVVLGSKALADPSLADPKTIFVTFAGKVFPGIGGEVLNWIIAFMLIIALALSPSMPFWVRVEPSIRWRSMASSPPSSRDQRTWRAGESHGLQRRRIPHCRFARRRGGDL